jgi:hypothetical protein
LLRHEQGRRDIISACPTFEAWDHGAEVITVSELLEIEACKTKAQEACNKLFATLVTTLREAEEFVSHVEQTKAVFEF